MALENKETLGNHRSMVACNRHRRVGPSGGGGGTTTPRVRPHPGGAASRPSSPGLFLDGPRPYPRWYSAQVNRVGGLLFLFPSRISALRLLFAPFGMFSTCIRIWDLQNMISPIQVELGQ